MQASCVFTTNRRERSDDGGRWVNEVLMWEQQMWVAWLGMNTFSAVCYLFFILGPQLFQVVSECWAPEPATEVPSSEGVTIASESERILNPVKLEEYPRK